MTVQAEIRRARQASPLLVFGQLVCPADATHTFDEHNEVSRAAYLIERVQGQHALNDHRAPAVEAKINHTLEVSRQPLNGMQAGDKQIEVNKPAFRVATPAKTRARTCPRHPSHQLR